MPAMRAVKVKSGARQCGHGTIDPWCRFVPVRKCLPGRYFVFCRCFDSFNAGVVNIQYTYSCISLYYCSAGILCCGIGPITAAASFTSPPSRLAIDTSSPESCGSPPLPRTSAAQISTLVPYPSTSDTITSSSRSVPEKPHQPWKHTFPREMK